METCKGSLGLAPNLVKSLKLTSLQPISVNIIFTKILFSKSSDSGTPLKTMFKDILSFSTGYVLTRSILSFIEETSLAKPLIFSSSSRTYASVKSVSALSTWNSKSPLFGSLIFSSSFLSFLQNWPCNLYKPVQFVFHFVSSVQTWPCMPCKAKENLIWLI